MLRREKTSAAREQEGADKTERYKQAVKQMSTEEKVAKAVAEREKMEDIEQSKHEKNEREYWRKVNLVFLVHSRGN